MEDMPGLQLQLLVNILSRLQTLEEFILANHVKDYNEEEKKRAVEKYCRALDKNRESINAIIYQQHASIDLNDILKPPTADDQQ